MKKKLKCYKQKKLQTLLEALALKTPMLSNLINASLAKADNSKYLEIQAISLRIISPVY